MRQIVDEHVLAEAVGAAVEGAAFVDAGEVVDEAAQHRAVVEHEGVDGDAFAGDPFGFFQSLFGGALTDAAETERPFAVKPSLPAIGRGLAVGDDDDLLVGGGFAVEHGRGQVQAVLQVGERIAHVPGRLRQIFGLEFDRAGKETDDAEVVARIERPHQTLHRQGDFFRRGEAPFPAHRPAHVQQAARWRRGC